MCLVTVLCCKPCMVLLCLVLSMCCVVWCSNKYKMELHCVLCSVPICITTLMYVANGNISLLYSMVMQLTINGISPLRLQLWG